MLVFRLGSWYAATSGLGLGFGSWSYGYGLGSVSGFRAGHLVRDDFRVCARGQQELDRPTAVHATRLVQRREPELGTGLGLRVRVWVK